MQKFIKFLFIPDSVRNTYSQQIRHVTFQTVDNETAKQKQLGTNEHYAN